LAELLGAGTSPNRTRGFAKAFRLLTRQEIADNGNFGEAFEDLDYSTCCLGTRVYIEFYQPDPTKPRTTNQVLVAVYDGSATPKGRVYVDGSFKAGELVPARFVPIDSDEANAQHLRQAGHVRARLGGAAGQYYLGRPRRHHQQRQQRALAPVWAERP
nr:hypothetical protein [Tanacetum cinerariifolium]